jgi:hypothetical protein
MGKMEFFVKQKETLMGLIKDGLTPEEIFERVRDKRGCPDWSDFDEGFQFFKNVIKEYIPPKKKTSYNGWCIRMKDGKYFELYKRIGGKINVIYVGKHWTDKKADEKIRQFYKKMITGKK